MKINESDVTALVPPDLIVDEGKTLCPFRCLTESDARAIITKSAKKYCKLDPLPTSLLVNCLDELLPVINAMVNLSLKEGYFPSEWKDALVKPLLTGKAGLSMDYKNLRPVTNLQFVSKVPGRAVFDQLHKHLEDNDLYPVFQSAYRNQHSTETALLRVVNDILQNMNRQHVTLLILLDLISAFDTVDHDIMIRRLGMSFGITGTALQWLGSYLSGRSQHILVNGEQSESLNLPFGVPNKEVKEKSFYNLRSTDELLLTTPTLKTLGDGAFQVAAPTLRNKLPSALRMETSLKPFKAKLKTLLFKEARSLLFIDLRLMNDFSINVVKMISIN